MPPQRCRAPAVIRRSFASCRPTASPAREIPMPASSSFLHFHQRRAPREAAADRLPAAHCGPALMRPSRTAVVERQRDRRRRRVAMTIDRDDHFFHARCPVSSRSTARMRMLAWCGISQSIVGFLHVAHGQRLIARPRRARCTANLNTALPSILQKRIARRSCRR